MATGNQHFTLLTNIELLNSHGSINWKRDMLYPFFSMSLIFTSCLKML